MKNGIYILCGVIALFACSNAGLYAQSAKIPPKITSYPSITTAGSDPVKKKTVEITLVKTQEVSKEIDVSKSNAVYIDNMYRDVIIKTWNQPKVKISTSIYYEGENKLSDEQWLEKINLSLKMVGSSVKIKSGSVDVTSTDNLIRRLPGIEVSKDGVAKVQGEQVQKVQVNGNNVSAGTAGNGLSFSSGNNVAGGGSNISATTIPSGLVYSGAAINSVAYFDGNGQNLGQKYNMKRVVTITVPAGTKLDIESKYADLSLPAYTGEVNIDITNGNLEAENLNNLILRSKYSNSNIGDIKTAELSVSNGRLSANNIDNLDIDTRASNIEIASAQKVSIISTNDEYEIEEVGEIRGKKDFGSLRITKLNASIEMNGSSADVKIRNLGPDVTLVKIEDRFANIRIPLNKVKNYSVDFTGSYSSVYGSFEKKALDNIVQATITTLGNLTAVTVTGILTDSKGFTTKTDPGSNQGVLKANTISGILTDSKGGVIKSNPANEVTVTGYGSRNGTAQGEAKATSPYITTVGTLNNLTVVGSITSVTNVSSLSTGVAKETVTTSEKLTNITVPGTITGGTFSGTLAPSTLGRITATSSSINPYAGNVYGNTNNTPSRFIAEVGDGKNLKIQIKCPNCTVDLK